MARLTGIPNEIKLEIIRQLPGKDKKSLSLSSREFRVLAAPEIYRSFTIITDCNASELLAVSKFGKFVKELTLVIEPAEAEALCPSCDQSNAVIHNTLHDDDYDEDLAHEVAGGDACFAKDDKRWGCFLLGVSDLLSGADSETYNLRKLAIHLPVVYSFDMESCEDVRAAVATKTLPRYDLILALAAKNMNLTELTVHHMPPVMTPTFQTQNWISLLGRLTHLEISLLGDFYEMPLLDDDEFCDFVDELEEGIFNHLTSVESLRIDTSTDHPVADPTAYRHFVDLAAQWQL